MTDSVGAKAQKTEAKLLEFRWTTSRGRETYGYNICSLWVDGSKVSSCNGGGYDMKGASLADFMAKEYQERLLLCIGKQSRCHQYHSTEHGFDQTHAPKGTNGRGESTFYGSTGYLNPELNLYKVSLDGACGFSSMERIAKAIGLTLQWKGQNRQTENYILTDRGI